MAAPGRRRPAPRSTPRSTGWCTTRAGPTSCRPCSAAANPVSGPYFSYSAPEPTGVVAALAPTDAPLLGLVSVIAPVLAGGNACVVVAAEPDAYVAVTFGEVLATSDVPGGVVNLLTGSSAEIAPHLAAHADVNALDLTGADAELATELEQAAVGHGQAGLPARRAPRTSPPPPAPPGCGRSWRSRRSGTRSAPCRSRVALRTEVPAQHPDRAPRSHRARVVLLAGPSGSGKSRVAALSACPQLRLDDFYLRPRPPRAPPHPRHRRLGRHRELGHRRRPGGDRLALHHRRGTASRRTTSPPADGSAGTRSTWKVPPASSPRVCSRPTWSRPAGRPACSVTRSTSTGPGC